MLKNHLPKLFIAGLLILLGGSFSLNLFLYRHLATIFTALHQTSLNPLGLEKYRDRTIKAKTDLPRVVFLGDSRAYQWQNPSSDDFEFINRGISGQTTAQILLRFSEHIAPLKPDIIVLQLGANDLRVPPSKEQTRLDIVANCQENITQIIAEASKLKAKVILTTIFPLSGDPVSWEYRPFWEQKNKIAQSITEVNQHLKTLGSSVIIFDAYELLETQDPNKEKYYRDLLHLNRHGYEILNQKLENILTNLSTK